MNKILVIMSLAFLVISVTPMRIATRQDAAAATGTDTTGSSAPAYPAEGEDGNDFLFDNAIDFARYQFYILQGLIDQFLFSAGGAGAGAGAAARLQTSTRVETANQILEAARMQFQEKAKME